jgi:hypothetical protein
MASFTDIKTPGFNPYIQQLPVEAMTSVGMEKQRRYDEGVKKIQTSIDNVAGLDLIRPEDKFYLQSKLKSLGTNLGVVAAGDFSNYQLVNSVSGMVGQIGKDPFVQEAVSSTARIKKQLSKIDAYKKEGKSDRNNELYFHEKYLTPYLNAGLKDEEGNPASFNGEYTPYTNVMDEIRKQLAGAGLDEFLAQQMYQTWPDGTIKTDSNGVGLPARTMTEVVSSDNADQVKAIVSNVLRQGNVQSQISIDAWANTYNIPVEPIAADLTQKYQKSFSQIDQSLMSVNTMLAGTTDDKTRAFLENQRKQLETERTSYMKQYEDLRALAAKSPEAFKEAYYKNNYENSLLEGFTKHKREEKNLQSPLVQQLNFEERMKFDKDNESFDRRMELATLSLTQQRLNMDINEQVLKYPATKLLRTVAATPGEGGISATQKTDEYRNQLENEKYANGFELIYTLLRRSKANNGLNRSGEPISREDVKRSIDIWSKQNGESSDQFITRWILDMDNKAKENGVTLTGQDRMAVNTFKDIHKKYNSLLMIDKIVNDKVYSNTGVNVNDYTKGLSVTHKSGKPFVDSKGNPIRFTKEDLLDYALAEKNNDKDAKKRFDTKYGKEFPYYVPYWNTFLNESGLAELLTKDLSGFNNAVKAKEEMLQQFTMTDESFSFAPEDEKGIKAAKSRINAFVSNSGNKLTMARGSEEDFLKALQSDGSIPSFKAMAPYREGEPWKGTVSVTDKGKTMEINVDSESDLSQLSGQKFSPFKFNFLGTKAQISEFGSTNTGTYTTDKDAWETAAINNDSFISLNKSRKYIPLGADLLPLSNGGYYVVTYIKEKNSDRKTPWRIEFPRQYVNGDEAERHIGMLDENMIDIEIGKLKNNQ